MTAGPAPLVSISCVTYNHERFIRDALEGFIMQKTDFPFEILIYDDASTDGNAGIIKEYEQRYPGLIFPYYQKENAHSKGIKSIAHRFNIPRARGKYIAPCEGDDFWTDPLKLQRQAEFLETHPGYAASTENGMVVHTGTGKEEIFSTEEARDVTIEEMVRKRRFPTASVMFRKELIRNLLNEVRFTNDTITWCYLATKGKIRYNTEISSVYRKGNHGMVLGTDTMIWTKTIEKWNLEYIRLFSPEYFDKSIAIRNIWEHYWKAYLKFRSGDRSDDARYCLKKCLKYNYWLTLKKILSGGK